MIKSLILCFFLSLGIWCHSKSISNQLTEFAHPQERLALNHIEYGDAHLLFHKYSEALDEFNKASSLIELLEGDTDILSFFVSFGKIVAYDNLGMVDQCKKAIGDLLYIVFEDENQDDVDAEDIEEKPSFSIENTSPLNFMRKLALLAPTPAVRTLLETLIIQMEEEISSPFYIAPSLSSNQTGWEYAQETDYRLSMCRFSVWQKLKKLGKQCSKIVNHIEDGLQPIVDFINFIDSCIER